MTTSEDIPDEVYEKAMAAYGSIPKAVRQQSGWSLVIATAIMNERNRIQQIIDAEREWGGGDHRDVKARIQNGDGPRLISGWNATTSDDDEDELIPMDFVYVKPRVAANTESNT